jgi:hypothetical protein
LSAQGLFAATSWSTVLAVADAGGFWRPGLVVKSSRASFGFYCHGIPLDLVG